MKKTILIVDDSESIRQIVNYTLEEAGYQVLIGVDGRDALKHLDGTGIDLVITDYHMPHIDGFTLIKTIRAHADYRYVPILLLTTESETSKKEEAKTAGATGWVVKPFVQEKLLAVVQKLVR